MPSDPPLPVTSVRKGLASGVHTPPGRTTVSLDLKGCLEEVGNHAARAGTWQRRHDHTEATSDSMDDGPPDPSYTLGPNRNSKVRRPAEKGARREYLGPDGPTSKSQNNFSIEEPQFKHGLPCEIRRTSLLHFAVKTNFRELISTYPNFQTPPRPSIVSPYTHPFGIQRTTARAAPSGTPGPSRAPGPPRAHPAPSQHTLLTDCPDSDSALPQATIQLSSIGISRHLRLRSAHRADGCPRLGRFARANLPVLATRLQPTCPVPAPAGPPVLSAHRYMQPRRLQRPVGPPLECQ